MSDLETVTPETPETPKTTHKRQMSFTVLDDGTIEATFGKGVDPIRLNPTETPERVQFAAITEGLISRARSYTSKLQDSERTPENLSKAVAKAFENLRNGVWKIEREASDGEPTYTIEVEAAFLFRKMKAESKNEPFTETLADVAALWESLTDDETEEKDGKKVVTKVGQKSQVKALPRYQQAYAQIKADRALAKAKKLAEKADKAEEEAPM
jgi:hypothetical protein